MILGLPDGIRAVLFDLDGVRSFLESRGIEPEPELVERLGTRKNELVLSLIREQGVEPYGGSIRYVEAAREHGLPQAVVSSSNNAREVLEASGLAPRFEVVGLIDYFDEIVDGRAGDFGYVVGVDRTGQADKLRERGADIVVRDLAELQE